MPHPTWPLFDVRLRTPRLTLRPVDESAAVELALLADDGVHPPDEMPFAVPWTRLPPDERRRGSMQHTWRQWAEWSADDWHLPFATYDGDRLVGTIDLSATRFPQRRVVSTGSWIGMAHQRQGYGTEQRAAVLGLAFGHLGAQRAETEAWADNTASQRVSERLGYRPNGDHVSVVEGTARRGVKFVLELADWEREATTNPHHVPVTVDGLGAALPSFGI